MTGLFAYGGSRIPVRDKAQEKAGFRGDTELFDKKDMRYGYAGRRLPVAPSPLVVFPEALRRVGKAFPLPRRKGGLNPDEDVTSCRVL